MLAQKTALNGGPDLPLRKHGPEVLTKEQDAGPESEAQIPVFVEQEELGGEGLLLSDRVLAVLLLGKLEESELGVLAFFHSTLQRLLHSVARIVGNSGVGIKEN